MLISVIIPTFNEEKTLENSIKTLEKALNKYNYEIIIANDGSTDKTTEIAKRLTSINPKIKQLYSKKRLGKGGGLKNAFAHANGDILIFTDADLSADVLHIKDLIKEIKNGADVCIGSRLLPNSKVKRCIIRDTFSKCYNSLVKLLFDTEITDFQCGFKAFRKNCLPIIKKTRNNGFFFDTELLLRAESKGLKITQIPINWEENKKSKVKIIIVSVNMLYNLIKIRLFGF